MTSQEAMTDRWIAHCREIVAAGREKRARHGAPRSAWKPMPGAGEGRALRVAPEPHAGPAADASGPGGVADAAPPVPAPGCWADGTPIGEPPPVWDYADDDEPEEAGDRWWDL